MGKESSGFLERPDGERLAWRRVTGSGSTVVWVGGWRSDMGGTKAEALAEAAKAEGWNYLRYDHFAHGESSGDWEEVTVGRWRDDLVSVIDDLTQGSAVLVGSSMGGWLACLAALARPRQVAAMVLIAPATDFLLRLMWPALSDAARQEIEETGRYMVADDGTGEHVLTRRLFESARDWVPLEDSVPIYCPVRILQGALDEPVPWRHALRLAEAIDGEDVVFSLIKDGDHRLSRPQDLDRLIATVGEAREAARRS